MPIIALTASVMPEEAERCLRAGMDAQLPKPIDPVALATALARHAPKARIADIAPARSGERRASASHSSGEHGRVAHATPVPSAADRQAGPGLPAAPIVDEGYVGLLIEALGAAKVHELIAGLPHDADSYGDRLHEACRRGDLSGVRAAAHGLKGIAANLGLTALADLTGAIEDACLSGASDRVASLSAQLEACLDVALARLHVLVPSGPSRP